MSKARQSRKECPETDNYICFDSGGKDAPWVNARRCQLVESKGPFDVIVVESFCGSDLPFGPNQARAFAEKILGWCDEIDK